MKFLVLALCAAVAFAGPIWMDTSEVALIRGSWNKVKANEVEILYLIFKQNPDIQAKFPAFVGKDLEALKATAPFAQHANKIISLLNKYIDLLGDDANDAAIKSMLNEMGEKHAVRGVSRAQFSAFKGTVVGYLKTQVKWNDSLASAWNTAFEKMYAIVFSHLP
jgi:hypothetical protein